MAKKNRWFFPTNTNNLRKIIAQGLLASPDGFKKYYKDALELLPGWIPIYKNLIPPNILEKGVSERANLTPCIIELDLNSIKGEVQIFKENDLINIRIDDIENEMVDVFYLLAPLPLSCILSILFQNTDDKRQFENDAQIRSNVILEGLTLKSTKVDQQIFKTESTFLDNSISTIPDDFKIADYQKINYQKVYSYGGLLLTMFYFGKNGNKSNAIYHSINELLNLSQSKENDIHLIYQYFKDSDKATELNPKEQIYNDLIEIAMKNTDFKEDVIELLESDKWDEKYQERTKNLSEKLESFENIGAGDKTVSNHFKEAKTPLEKILLMLFLREDSDALVDYNLDIFSEDDYIQFAMIFGIRDQFIKTPRFLREFKGLQNFISQKMAMYAHKQANSALKFEGLKTPLTLMDMLQNNEFKKWFAKYLKIEDCFQTKISISKGEYELKVAASRVEIIFDGIAKTPVAELIEEKFFKFISKYKFKEYEKYFDKYQLLQ